MKHIGNKLLLLLTAALMITMMSATAFAEIDGSCYFDGKDIVSDFSNEIIAESVSNMQPGDDVSFTVEYINKDEHETDWYMENSIIQTLEKTDAASKTVQGTGTPEHGGYTYSLIHTDKDGNETVLFSNDKVGGEAKPANMEGLEQATNALDDWFYLETLSQGDSGRVTLNVALDGETEVNDYMDTRGALELKFAVELTRKNSPAPDDEDEDSGKPKKPGSSTYTGDNNDLMIWTAACVIAATLLLILAIFSIRRDRKEAKSDEEA